MVYQVTQQQVIDTLQSQSIKPSAQRMLILRHLMEHRVHPTVDEIFISLSPDHPTLSKTTVYNTLRLLSDKGIIRCIDTGLPAGARWDFSQHDHGHFVCTECGGVTDVDFKTSPVNLPLPPTGFQVASTDILYRGICPNCTHP